MCEPSEPVIAVTVSPPPNSSRAPLFKPGLQGPCLLCATAGNFVLSVFYLPLLPAFFRDVAKRNSMSVI